MSSQPHLAVTKKQHFWPGVLVGVVAIKAVFSLALNPSFVLAAGNASVYMVLLLFSIVLALRNAEQGIGGSRTFWLFMAGGFALWAFDQGLYLYYGIGLRTDVPDSSIADPALFLHVVPLMAAVAMQPHLRQPDQKSSRATLNFLMLLFFWVFLYAYALFPYQYLFADAAIYNPRFTAFYALENAALVLALGITALRAPPPWKSVYFHFFAAAALYGISSTLANIAIDHGWHYNGSIYSLAQTAAVCWFVWVPLHASQLPVAETVSTEPDPGRFGYTSLLAKTAVIAIPLIGMLELFTLHQPSGMRTFRLAVVLASVLLLTAAVFLKEHLARRDLALDSRISKLQEKLSEAALVTSEGRYRDLVEALPDAIFVAKEERIVFVNPSAVRLLGAQRPEQIVGKELSEIVHPVSLGSIRSRIRDSRAGVASPPMEHVLLALDGSSVQIESASIPVTWKGSPAIEAIARDIRQRKRAEKSLREYEKVIEGLEEMIAVVDREYRYVLANRAFLNYRGVERENLIGHSSREMLNEGVFDAVIKDKLDECFEGKVVKYELRYKYPKLGERDVAISYFPIEGPDGIDRAACVIQDITERKRAEEASRRLGAIVESSDDAIVSKDLNGVITSWNAGAQRIFGYAEAEVVGHSITIIIPPELRDEETLILQRLRAGEHIQHYETVRVTKQGKKVNVSLTISPMRDSEGRIVGASKIARDITGRKQAEETLRRSEAEAQAQAEELAAILDAVPGMALISRDPLGESITGSRVAYEWLRLPYGTNISKSAPDGERPSNFRVVKDGQELPAGELPVQKAAVTGQVVRESEITLLFEDGSKRDMLGNAAPLLNEEGKVRGAVGVFVDISKRRRAEEALRTSEREQRKIAEQLERERTRLMEAQAVANVGSWETELPSLDITWSEQTHRIFGTDPSNFRPSRPGFVELVHPEDRAKVDAAFEASLEKGGGPSKVEYRIVSADGRVKVLEEQWKVFHDGQGRPTRLIGTCQDITERQRAEQALRLFRVLLDQSSDAIEVVEPVTLRFIDINDRACVDLGYTREELLSMSAYDIDPNLDQSLHTRVMNQLRMSGSTIFESLHRRRDGSTFPVEVSIKQVQLDRIYMVSVVRDITERKRAEQALQESQAALTRIARIATMGELTASIAHEINQPLAAVATNASASLHWLAVQPPNLAEAREAMASAMREAKRASSVVEKIRTLLKKASPELRPLDMNEVIQEALALSHNQLLTGGVAVRTKLASEIPTVLGDRIQLQQVMLNLIMNAVEAMVARSDRPRTLLIQSATDAEGVLVQVEDSGKGLDPEQLTDIFESFYTTKPHGTGMGLSISRSIVEAHGGRLWASARSPYGAVFQFVLPKAESGE